MNDYINRIAPNHSRTSCSDENLINAAYGIEDFDGHGRCYRCTLLVASLNLGFLQACKNEVIRGNLRSLPKKLEFMEERRMMSPSDVEHWMIETRRDFEDFVERELRNF